MKKKKRKIKPKIKKITIFIITILSIAILSVTIKYYLTANKPLKKVETKKEYYTISDFGYIKQTSKKDYNNNNIDDYQDILEGAKKYAKLNPKYKSAYYANGYPPVEKEGVCTDLIWYALQQAGYDLKSMISQDITENQEEYNIEIQDDNIDFRRVGNQEIFLKKYAESLTTDIYDTKNFMPGDILTFDNSAHIAMVSDKYNKNGVPYLIQNRDETQKQKEEDRLEITEMKVTGHYRFTYNKKLEKLINKIK